MSSDSPQTPLPIQSESATPGSYTLPDNSKKIRSSVATDKSGNIAIPVSSTQNFKTLSELPHLSSNFASGSDTDREKDLMDEYRMIAIKRQLRRSRKQKSNRSTASSAEEMLSQGGAPANPSEAGYAQGTWSSMIDASSSSIPIQNSTSSLKPVNTGSTGDEVRSNAALATDHPIGSTTGDFTQQRSGTATGAVNNAHYLPVPSSPMSYVPIPNIERRAPANPSEAGYPNNVDGRAPATPSEAGYPNGRAPAAPSEAGYPVPPPLPLFSANAEVQSPVPMQDTDSVPFQDPENFSFKPISTFPQMTEEHVNKLLAQQRIQLEAKAKAEKSRAVQAAYLAADERSKAELNDVKAEIRTLDEGYRKILESNSQERNSLIQEREYAVQAVQIAVENKEKELNEQFRIELERQHAIQMQSLNERAAMLQEIQAQNNNLGLENAEQKHEMVRLHDQITATRMHRDTEFSRIQSELTELRNMVKSVTPPREVTLLTTNEIKPQFQQYVEHHVGTPSTETKDEFWTPSHHPNDLADEIKSQESITTNTTYKGDTRMFGAQPDFRTEYRD